MKKLAILVTATMLLLSTGVFASVGNEVNAKVKTAFQKDFSSASNVNWEAKDNFYFAEFKLNDIGFGAAYNEDGQLVATSRNIRLDYLPLAVTQNLKEKYAGYSYATNVTEVTYERQTSYYLTIANEKQVLHLKADANGNITVESKTKR